MTPIKYGKLVRDNIPEIIREDGWEPTVRFLTDGNEEYLAALRAKLIEEVGEYLGATTPDDREGELADIHDTVLALGEAELLHVRDRAKAKREVRGGFEDRVFLVEISAAEVSRG